MALTDKEKSHIVDGSSLLLYPLVFILAIINFFKIKGRLQGSWEGEMFAANIGSLFGSLLAIFVLYAIAKIIFSAVRIKKEKLSREQSTLIALSLALFIKFLLDSILGR